MYASDKEDFDNEITPSSAKYPKSRFSRKLEKMRSIDEDNSSQHRSGQPSDKNEESTDFTSSFSKKAAFQDCLDLKNIVKCSVDSIQDLINLKLQKITDKFEIINEENEEQGKYQFSNNQIRSNVRKKTIEARSEKDNNTKSSNTQQISIASYNSNASSNLQNYSTALNNNSLNNNGNLNTSFSTNQRDTKKSKTRNLSGQKKLDSLISSTKAKVKTKNCVSNAKVNTKPSSKSDLLDIKPDQFNSTQTSTYAVNNLKIVSDNKNLSEKIKNINTFKNKKQDFSKKNMNQISKTKSIICSTQLPQNQVMKSISRNISIDNKKNEKRFVQGVQTKDSSMISNSKEIQTSKQCVSSRKSTENFSKTQNFFLDQSHDTPTCLLEMMQVFNEYNLDKSLSVKPFSVILKNQLEEASIFNSKLNSKYTSISGLSIRNRQAIKIQRFWRQYKVRNILNMDEYNLPRTVDSYLKKELFFKLENSDLFSNFVNMMNNTIKSFKMLQKSGKFQLLFI